MKTFLAQVDGSSSKQPSSLMHDRNMQMCAAITYTAEFDDKSVEKIGKREEQQSICVCAGEWCEAEDFKEEESRKFIGNKKRSRRAKTYTGICMLF